MDSELKRVPQSFSCPNCGQTVTIYLSKPDLESVLTCGAVDAHHITCEYNFTVRLDAAMKANIKNLIETEFPE